MAETETLERNFLIASPSLVFDAEQRVKSEYPGQ